MKKDIEFPTVEGVKVAVVKTINEESYPEWNVYIINRKAEVLKNVLVSSTPNCNSCCELVLTGLINDLLVFWVPVIKDLLLDLLLMS